MLISLCFCAIGRVSEDFVVFKCAFGLFVYFFLLKGDWMFHKCFISLVSIHGYLTIYYKLLYNIVDKR